MQRWQPQINPQIPAADLFIYKSFEKSIFCYKDEVILLSGMQ
jgi:hypothetical protein